MNNRKREREHNTTGTTITTKKHIHRDKYNNTTTKEVSHMKTTNGTHGGTT